MSREITITLPDSIEISGAKDAPEKFKTVSTEKWEPEFIIHAIEHGISQKLGDAWSVSKKDPAKMETVHANLTNGDWESRNRGVSNAKFTEKLTGMDAASIWKLLSPQQQAALLAQGGNIQSLTLSGK